MVFETGKNVILIDYLVWVWSMSEIKIWKVLEQGFRSWFKGPKQRQRGVSGRWRIWRKSRWTDFDFVEIPSFVTLFIGVNARPLYFLKMAEKGISDRTLTGTWGHVVLPGLGYFKTNYLKPVRSRNISFQKFDILPVSYHNTCRSISYICGNR